MAFKRIVAKSEQDLEKIMDDIMKWFKETNDYKVSFSKESRKFQDPETKKIVEKQIDVIKVTDKVNDKQTSIKFIPMVEKGEMKVELGGEGEAAVAGKIANQMKGKGALKSYSKDKKVALKESNIMKKSELKQLIKEEISKILSEEDNNVKADKIIGLFNDNQKKGKSTKIEYNGKQYELIDFLGMNYKTILFKTNKGEKRFKHNDVLTLIK